MTKGEKLQRFIDHLGMSRLAFATRIGVTSTAINGIVSNFNRPGHKVLAGIKKEYPQFNIDWLLNDEGDMLRPDDLKAKESDYLQEHLTGLEEQFKRLLNQLEAKDTQIEVKDRQLESKDRQIEKLMDLLGKLNLGGKTPWGKMLPHPATEEMEAA